MKELKEGRKKKKEREEILPWFLYYSMSLQTFHDHCLFFLTKAPSHSAPFTCFLIIFTLFFFSLVPSSIAITDPYSVIASTTQSWSLSFHLQGTTISNSTLHPSLLFFYIFPITRCALMALIRRPYIVIKGGNARSWGKNY